MGPDPLRIDFPGLPDAAVNRPGKGTKKGKDSAPTGPRLLFRLFAWALGLCLFALLPFFALIRTSVFLLHRYEISGWAALAGGVAVTVLLLFLYLVVVSLRLGRKGRVPKSLRRGIGLLVGSYCLFALMYLSSANAKTEEIRSTYSALNPILRVGVSTLLLVDREGVLTDTGRTPEDYARWGLPVNEASLHLPQADGYVYAVDIRTVGRPEWQNRAAAFYFRLMGFQTLRHVGTADHLHVSLVPPRS